MKKNRLLAVVCVLVVAFSLCVPAFASSVDLGSGDITIQGIQPYVLLPDTSRSPAFGNFVFTSTRFNYDNFYCTAPVYIWASSVDTSAGTSGFQAFSTEPFKIGVLLNPSSPSGYGALNAPSSSTSDALGTYYAAGISNGASVQGGNIGDLPVIPITPSQITSDDLGSSVSDTGEPISVVLPAGNVIFVELPSGQANQIEASTSSALDHSSPWNGSNQAWGYASSLPSSNFSVPYPGTTPFSWKHAGKTNIFGTTRNWSFFSLLDSSNKYLVVVNPAYPEDLPTNQAINGSITLSLPHALSYRVYSLSTEWNSGNLVGSWDSETDPTFSGDYDPDTGSWASVNDQTGSPGSPSAGGNNIVSESGQNIHDWLQSIANSISGFFNGAIGAVTTLTSAASEFVGSFIHLYSWLPTSVLSVLTSAIILAITIGVIKVFI